MSVLDEDTKITLKAGVLISLITSLAVFLFTVVWMHQTDITLLKTNQNHILKVIDDLKTVPAALQVLGVKIDTLDTNLKEHRLGKGENR